MRILFRRLKCGHELRVLLGPGAQRPPCPDWLIGNGLDHEPGQRPPVTGLRDLGRVRIERHHRVDLSRAQQIGGCRKWRRRDLDLIDAHTISLEQFLHGGKALSPRRGRAHALAAQIGHRFDGRIQRHHDRVRHRRRRTGRLVLADEHEIEPGLLGHHRGSGNLQGDVDRFSLQQGNALIAHRDFHDLEVQTVLFENAGLRCEPDIRHRAKLVHAKLDGGELARVGRAERECESGGCRKQ